MGFKDEIIVIILSLLIKENFEPHQKAERENDFSEK